MNLYKIPWTYNRWLSWGEARGKCNYSAEYTLYIAQFQLIVSVEWVKGHLPEAFVCAFWLRHWIPGPNKCSHGQQARNIWARLVKLKLLEIYLLRLCRGAARTAMQSPGSCPCGRREAIVRLNLVLPGIHVKVHQKYTRKSFGILISDKLWSFNPFNR